MLFAGDGVISILVVLVLLDGHTSSPCKESLAVKTSEGYVIGCKNIALDMTTFYGIPYATSPREANKFKAPLPPPVRFTPLFATNDAIFCPQSATELPSDYQEDCLVLNVFVPGEGRVTDTLWPVVVYVHGGRLFESGYGTQLLPVGIVQSGVVAVTFNHRVGAHGFLCLGTPEAPGNAALKDSVAALQWVRKNIANFKGDPGRVTLAGFGAGADIALLLLLSPRSYEPEGTNATSSKLFQKVILESTFALDAFALNEDPVQIATDWASKAGAQEHDLENPRTLSAFFTSISFEKLFSPIWEGEFRAGFGPCVELTRLESAAVVKHPTEALQKDVHYFNNVPVLIGYSDGEGQLFISSKDSWLYKMCIDFPKFLPPNFRVYDQKKQLIAEWVRGEYLERDLTDEYTARRFVEYFTDSVFAYETVWTARALSQYTQVFLYEFTYVGSLDDTKYSFLGAGHLAATRYLMHTKDKSPTLGNDDRLVKDRTVAMWSNFIKHGKPIISSDLRLNVYWEPIDGEKVNYMQIHTNLVPKQKPREKAISLWENFWAKNIIQTETVFRDLDIPIEVKNCARTLSTSVHIFNYVLLMAVCLFVN